MNGAQTNPYGVLRKVTSANRAELSRRAKAGVAKRLAPGIYVENAAASPQEVTRHHLFAIVAMIWPDAVLCGRTALDGGVPRDARFYLADPTRRRPTPLKLPGITIVPSPGPGTLPGDMAMPNGLFISGPARSLVENVTLRGRPALFRAGSRAVEDRIDEMARAGGAGRIREILTQLDVIAPSFERESVAFVRARLAALLGSFEQGTLKVDSRRLEARLSGEPFDLRRLDLLRGLVEVLGPRAPRPAPMLGDAARWAWEPFFEAYFSNFIEGTEFGVDEARGIAIDHIVPEARPADVHDVAATYQLANDPRDRVRIPHSGEELIGVLRDRHRLLMAARPEKHPGELKTRMNFAGGYQFVEPDLVQGTLSRGFEILNGLSDPFARAVAMMVLITECHPFDDGNGRVARLTVNAELSAAGQVRIIIPTVYRNDYLASLTGLSRGVGRGESLIAVLEFAQRWTGEVDWQSFDKAHRTLQGVNAYVDPGVADASGIRLMFPSRFDETGPHRLEG